MTKLSHRSHCCLVSRSPELGEHCMVSRFTVCLTERFLLRSQLGLQPPTNSRLMSVTRQDYVLELRCTGGNMADRVDYPDPTLQHSGLGQSHRAGGTFLSPSHLCATMPLSTPQAVSVQRAGVCHRPHVPHGPSLLPPHGPHLGCSSGRLSVSPELGVAHSRSHQGGYNQ